MLPIAHHETIGIVVLNIVGGTAVSAPVEGLVEDGVIGMESVGDGGSLEVGALTVCTVA